MTTTLETLEVKNRKAWRQWLARHHASSPGVWLVRHKKQAGGEKLSYEDIVCEALCFGWIDSLVKRVDDERFLTKVTPRRATSNWSDLNRARWKRLKEEGLLAPAGLTAAPTASRYQPKPAIPQLPAYIASAFQAHAKAWKFFQTLPPSQRRYFIGWIHTAKREDTRARRIRESIKLLAAGKTLGLK